MSAIPPNPLASVIQAHGAQTRELAQQRAEATEQTARNSGFQERLTDAISSVERDNAVYTDAEGAGSRGRAFSESPEEEPDAEPRKESGTTPGGQVDVCA